MLDGQEVSALKVIEMNRFNETTGGGLFDWDNDRDVLFGRKPFESRVSSPRATGNAATAFSVLDRPGRFVQDFKDMRKLCRETILNETQKQ
jgi:hypothetical protein